FRAEPLYQGGEPALVLNRQEGSLGKSLFVGFHQVGKVLLEKGHKDFFGARFQEQRDRRDGACARVGRGAHQVFQVRRRIRDSWQNGSAIDAGREACLHGFPPRLETQVRARRARLQNARKIGSGGGYGDVNAEAVIPRDGLQQIEIADDQVRLGYQSKGKPPVPCQLFHDGARHSEFPLRRLVRIGGGADGDALTRAHLLELLAQEPGAVLLDVNLALKIQAVAQLHELVGVARVAVFAGKLASPVGIDHPGEGHARGVAAREDAAVVERDVVNFVPFRQRFSLGREFGDSHQRSFRDALREQRTGRHGTTHQFVFYSLLSQGATGNSRLPGRAGSGLSFDLQKAGRILIDQPQQAAVCGLDSLRWKE